MKSVGGQAALPPPQDGAQGDAKSIPTVQPWVVYDEFVNGKTIDEIMVWTQRPEAEIRADIEQMRLMLIEQHPGITDLEADRIRFEDLLIRQARLIGDPPALKQQAEAAVRRRAIIDAAARRLAEEKKLNDALA